MEIQYFTVRGEYRSISYGGKKHKKTFVWLTRRRKKIGDSIVDTSAFWRIRAVESIYVLIYNPAPSILCQIQQYSAPFVILELNSAPMPDTERFVKNERGK